MVRLTVGIHTAPRRLGSKCVDKNIRFGPCPASAAHSFQLPRVSLEVAGDTA